MNENLISRHTALEGQTITLDGKQWDISRLIYLSADFEVEKIPVKHIYLGTKYNELTLREMLRHIVAVMECTLDHPIILDDDGFILDGRHRLMKSIIEGKQTIDTVRFYKMPEPCRVVDDE